jgi:hypothetical protein
MTPTDDPQSGLRQHTLELLRGGSAHLSFDQALADLPTELRGAKADGQPHTIWRLLEHLRINQEDVLGYAVDPDHPSPAFPEGYWPDTDAPPSDAAWDASIASFRDTARRFEQLLEDPQTDLLAPLPHDPHKSILRQALLNADHNSYHLGQIILLRRLMDAPAATV